MPFLALFAALALPLAAQEEPRPEVEAVRFPGREALPASRIEEAIATAASSCKSPLLLPLCRLGDFDFAERRRFLDRDELRRDVERIEALYEIWGYPDAEVEARVEPTGAGAVAVHFEIDEGRPIRVTKLEVRGLDTLSPPLRLRRPLPLSEGDAYALPELERTLDRIRSALAERGRPYAEVEVGGEVDAEAGTARVVLEVEPGPVVRFGDVAVRAASPIDEEVVRERVAFEPGERFRPSRVAQTEEQLYELPAVGRAVVRPLGLEARDTVVPVVVAVSPRKLQGLEFEGTISSAECLQAAAFWRHRYFLGGPRLFTVGGGVSNLFAGPLGGNFPCSSTGGGEFGGLDYFARAEVLQPWPGSPRTRVVGRAFVNRESVPNVYVQEGWGGMLGVSRRFGPALTAALTYAPERMELDAAGIYFCGNFGICAEALIAELTEPTWLAPLEATASWTPTGAPGAALRPPPEDEAAPPLPEWLYWTRLGLETGAPPSSYRFGRGIAEGALTRRIGPRLELGARTRLGLLAGEEPLPPQMRLFSGGVQTVRGVPQNMLGPKALVADPADLAALGCDPAVDEDCLDPALVNARPLGGETLVEANLEARYWLTGGLQLAAFVDWGALRRDASPAASAECTPEGGWSALLAPGAGLRLITGIGPIRVDVGYDPSGARRFPLLTVGEAGALRCLGLVEYDPYGFDDPSAPREFWRRLELHVAIGQLF